MSLRSVLILFKILHVETMFGNEGEGFLHACISSIIAVWTIFRLQLYSLLLLKQEKDFYQECLKYIYQISE